MTEPERDDGRSDNNERTGTKRKREERPERERISEGTDPTRPATGLTRGGNDEYLTRGDGVVFTRQPTEIKQKPKTIEQLCSLLPERLEKVREQLGLMAKNKATQKDLEDALKLLQSDPDSADFGEHARRMTKWIAYILERGKTQTECVVHISNPFLSGILGVEQPPITSSLLICGGHSSSAVLHFAAELIASWIVVISISYVGL